LLQQLPLAIYPVKLFILLLFGSTQVLFELAGFVNIGPFKSRKTLLLLDIFLSSQLSLSLA